MLTKPLPLRRGFFIAIMLIDSRSYVLSDEDTISPNLVYTGWILNQYGTVSWCIIRKQKVGQVFEYRYFQGHSDNADINDYIASWAGRTGLTYSHFKPPKDFLNNK